MAKDGWAVKKKFKFKNESLDPFQFFQDITKMDELSKFLHNIYSVIRGAKRFQNKVILIRFHQIESNHNLFFWFRILNILNSSLIQSCKLHTYWLLTKQTPSMQNWRISLLLCHLSLTPWKWIKMELWKWMTESLTYCPKIINSRIYE